MSDKRIKNKSKQVRKPGKHGGEHLLSQGNILSSVSVTSEFVMSQEN